MSFVIGGFAALVALAAGILANVDPVTSLWRAALAFALGWIGANIWYAVTTTTRPQSDMSEGLASPEEASPS
jgi:hypothetical protein